jgi:hypothetical protein
MAETMPPETLQTMVERYEETLRLLIEKADDDARFYNFRHTPQSRHQLGLYEFGKHDLFQEIRRIAVHTLHEFHPDVKIE